MFNHNFGTQWFWNHWFETNNGTIGSNNKIQLSIQLRKKRNIKYFSQIFITWSLLFTYHKKKNYTKD